jgi:hypothetical protein
MRKKKSIIRKVIDWIAIIFAAATLAGALWIFIGDSLLGMLMPVWEWLTVIIALIIALPAIVLSFLLRHW